MTSMEHASRARYRSIAAHGPAGIPTLQPTHAAVALPADPALSHIGVLQRLRSISPIGFFGDRVWCRRDRIDVPGRHSLRAERLADVS